MIPKIRVSIVSSSRLFRDAVALRLANENQLEVVGVSATARGLLRKIGTGRVDVALVHSKDLSLDVVDTVFEIKVVHPATHVVLLGCTQNETETVASIEAGASAVLEHSVSLELLLQTIRCVNNGRTAGSMQVLAGVARRIAEFADAEEPAPSRRPKKPLTAREREVAQLVALGLANKEVASVLGVSTPTIKNFVHSILGKLELDSRREV